MFFVVLEDYTTAMKIRIFLSLLTFCGMITGSAYSQGKIVLLNGKEKRFTTAEVKGESILYQPEGSTSTTYRNIDLYDVFSINRDGGTEEVIYNPDTISGEDLTINEVRDYIKGERYAELVYDKPVNFVTALELGAVSGFVLPVFYGIAVPLLYPIGLAQFTPKVKPPIMHNYNDLTGKFEALHPGTTSSNIIINDSFSAGYARRAKNIKFKKSLLGGGIGFAIGATAIALIISR